MPSRTEEQLYASIEKALKNRGLEVRERLTVRVGLKTRTPDHVAWRWNGTELQLFAVEAKVGLHPADGAVALAQATEYQVGVPYVFAAAEGSVKDLGYLTRVLEHLRVGYIRAKRGTRSAGEIESDPGVSPFLEDVVHLENVARIRLMHLWRPDVVSGAQKHRGHDQRPDFWVATVKDRWQLCGQVKLESTHTTVSLLAENKGLCTRFSERARPGVVAQVLRALEQETGQNAELVVHERVNRARRVSCPRLLFSWNVRDPEEALAASLRRGRKLAETKWHGPRFEVSFELWAHTVMLTEHEARKRLSEFAAVLEKARGALDAETNR